MSAEILRKSYHNQFSGRGRKGTKNLQTTYYKL